jgi:hypothetical protein
MFAATGAVNTHKASFSPWGSSAPAPAAWRRPAPPLAPKPAPPRRRHRPGHNAPGPGPGATNRAAFDPFRSLDSAESAGPAVWRTKGERLYASEGLRGIRGEAEDGFPRSSATPFRGFGRGSRPASP